MNLYILNNPVLTSALLKADSLLKNKRRVIALVIKVIGLANRLERKNGIASEIKNKIYILGRMLKATASRQYKAVPWKAVLVITATLSYFINTVDIIPDFIPFMGFTDDFSILLWMFNSIQNEIEAFLNWENSISRKS